ncbi:AtpZ/AtpI family protein [Modestobacter marinus]|uniref:AtpZ/AtpI family protein n=1 Tax=Modestobacter marinus TaxID=477641 RepID=UPI001C986379|nr:AtpZ/AtpI family protein [Modestobacter marinus]
MAEDTPARGGARPRSETSTQHQPSGADVGWGITGTMLSGIIVWGGVGLALDRWLGTQFFVLIGVILGLSVAIYIVIMKYAPPVPPAGRAGRGTASGGRRSRPRTQKGQR